MPYLQLGAPARERERVCVQQITRREKYATFVFQITMLLEELRFNI